MDDLNAKTDNGNEWKWGEASRLLSWVWHCDRRDLISTQGHPQINFLEVVKIVNQIGHLMINHRWRQSLLDVRVFRCADLNTDHFLIAGSIRLKLKRLITRNLSRRGTKWTVSRMKRYRRSIVIGFDLVLELHLARVLRDVENIWNTIKDGFCKAAEATLKYME